MMFSHDFGSEDNVMMGLLKVLIPRVRLQADSVYEQRRAWANEVAPLLAGVHTSGDVAAIWSKFKDKPYLKYKLDNIERALGMRRDFCREVHNIQVKTAEQSTIDKFLEPVEDADTQTNVDVARKMIRLLFWPDNVAGFPWAHFNFYVLAVMVIGGAMLHQVLPSDLADQIVITVATFTVFVLVLAMLISINLSFWIFIIAAGLDLVDTLVSLFGMLYRTIRSLRKPTAALPVVIEDAQ